MPTFFLDTFFWPSYTLPIKVRRWWGVPDRIWSVAGSRSERRTIYNLADRRSTRHNSTWLDRHRPQKPPWSAWSHRKASRRELYSILGTTTTTTTTTTTMSQEQSFAVGRIIISSSSSNDKASSTRSLSEMLLFPSPRAALSLPGSWLPP